MAAAGTGVDLEAGGIVTNNASSSINGGSFGVFVGGGADSLSNSGSIAGGSTDGVLFTLGGTLSNAAGASITGGRSARQAASPIPAP